MQKIPMAILCSLLLPVGVSMATTASDGKKDEHPVIIIWEPAGTPIYRLAPEDIPD